MCIISSLVAVGAALGTTFSAIASGLATAGAAVGSAVTGLATTAASAVGSIGASIGGSVGSLTTSLGTGLASLTTGEAMMIGGGLSAGFGVMSGAVSTMTSAISAYAQNKAVEDQYQQEVDMARQKAAYDQQRQNEETHERLLRNAQEARDSSLESMQIRANAEAAMSALNIAGNSGQREVGVADVTQIRREGAYAENEDVIGVQHLMSQIGINKQYEWDTTAAKRRAKSNWQDVGGIVTNGIIKTITDIPKNFLSGAAFGSMFGGGAGSAGYQMPSFQQSVAGAKGTAFGVSSPTVPTLASPAGGAFGMALA